MMGVLDSPSWTPAVQDVANYLIARTRMANGELAGTFNSLTFPTDVQVLGIIQQQVSLYAPRMGDVSDNLADSATALLALRAAIVVEESYFVEQIATDLSAHKEMVDEFKFAMMDWRKAAEGDVPNGARTASEPIGTQYPGYATGTY
jgi:hypothetical protein